MNPRALWTTVFLALLAGCPKAVPPPSADAAAAAEAARASAEAEALVQAQEEALWRHWTQGAPLDLGATYPGHEALFSPGTIASVQRAMEQAVDPLARRALLHLKIFLVGEHLAQSLGDQTEAIANLEASLTFARDGKEYRYRELEALLANETNASIRRALYDAATPAVERLTQALQRKEEKLMLKLGALGYPSYEAYGSELREMTPDRLLKLADEVLRTTQTAYLAVLAKSARKELAIPLEGLQRADFPRLFRPPSADSAFPPGELLPRASATFAGLEVKLDALPALTLELQDAAKKSAHPLHLAVKVPSDVRVSMRVRGGVQDQAALLYALGVSCQHLFAKPGRFELTKLGNASVTEAYGLLFAELVEDPTWLAEHTSLEGAALQEYLQDSAVVKLFRLRRAAGSLVYQLSLRRQETVDPQTLYRQVMATTYGVPFGAAEGARYALAAEDFYPAADQFRAALLAAQLQTQLKTRFGPAWWKSAEAGAWLKELWSHGHALSPDDLARQVGEPALRADAAVLRLASALQTPIPLPAPSP